jgi:quinohemoprotein ethanol dehydrogenase
MSAGSHAAFDDIVLDGLKVQTGMPRWGDVLTQADAAALHAYLIDVAQKAWAAQQAHAAAPARARAVVSHP